jgi:hypothetical protein
MLGSFYGGKAGTSFVIVKDYASVSAMAEDFTKGPQFELVNFGEYVLINTVNKNDPDNGKIYRRGYDYLNDLGGALYVGTIVGPAGKAPMLELMTMMEVDKKQATEGYDIRRGEGSYAPTENLVPGKDGDTYNDEIQWNYCSIRDENEEDCTAYIGFKIPYTVIDFIASSVSPYYNRDNNTSNFSNTDLIDRSDDKQHPFYEKWNVSIPKGIKGDAFKNFRVIEASTSIQNYDGRDDDIDNKRKVLVYDYYHYDKLESGEPVTMYLGDYNMITGITLDNDGTFTIEYSHNDTITYPKLVKWITSITLNGTTGAFNVTYNEGTKYDTNLRWVNNVVLAEDGTVTLKYTTGNDVVLNNKIKWITSVAVATNGTITVTYNDKSTDVFDKKIQWISSISLTDEGLLTVKYNNGTTDYTKNLVWATDVKIADDGTITVTYNNGTKTEHEKYLKVVSNMKVNSDDTNLASPGNQKLHVTYNTGDEEDIGSPLNYIMKMAINEDNYHFLILYSDPEKRQELINQGTAATYNNINGWLDLGAIRDYSGLLIGPHLKKEDDNNLSSSSTITSVYLNQLYPNGLTGTDSGKVIIVEISSTDKFFYAFDYDAMSWYYLGSLSSTPIIVGKASDSDITTKMSALNDGGIWFILEES